MICPDFIQSESMISGVWYSNGTAVRLTKFRYSIITTRRTNVTKQPKNPFHPGEMLLEEFLVPMEMSQAEFARRYSVTHRKVELARIAKIYSGTFLRPHLFSQAIRRTDWSTAVSPETRSKGQALNVNLNFTLTPIILNARRHHDSRDRPV